MFKKDIDLVMALHDRFHFQAPLLDAGCLENPAVADYSISVAKAVTVSVTEETGTRQVKIPHGQQSDRYLQIRQPWKFIDKNYLILNPERGDPYIEDLPEKYPEHVNNPYIVSDALYKILKQWGYLINSAPFLFPYHPSPENNFRFSPLALKRIHEASGFTCLESDFHINHSSAEGIGDTNPRNYGASQAIIASYALCRK